MYSLNIFFYISSKKGFITLTTEVVDAEATFLLRIVDQKIERERERERERS